MDGESWVLYYKMDEIQNLWGQPPPVRYYVFALRIYYCVNGNFFRTLFETTFFLFQAPSGVF